MSKIKRSKIKKIRGRKSISVGTWDVRTLRSAGKLEELTHAMSRYHWNMLGPARCVGKTMVRCQQMMDTRFISVEKSSDMSMVLDSLCIRMPTSLQQTNLNPLEGSAFQYHHHTGLCTNIWT